MKYLFRKLHPYLRQSGMAGFVYYFDLPGHQLLTRILLLIDRKFIGALQFARDWVRFESQLEKKSVPDVARSIYDYLRLELNTKKIPREFSRPGQPAILLGLNHEAAVEPIFLVSLLYRDDIKFIGMKVFQYLGPRLSEYILPLLPRKFATDYPGKTRATLSNKLDPFYQLYCLENMSTEEIHRQNQNSIQQAAGHVSEGGALIIFPNGGRPIDSPWYQGIGQILSRLPVDIIGSTPIFPIMLSGLTRKIIYRKIQQAAFSQPETTPLNVHIYEPLYLPPWAIHATPEELLDYLRSETNRRLESPSVSPPQVPTKKPSHATPQHARELEKSLKRYSCRLG